MRRFLVEAAQSTSPPSPLRKQRGVSCSTGSRGNSRLRIITLFLCIVVLITTTTPAIAQTDAAAVAQKAANYLASKLPKPFPGIEAYTFSPETWPDAGLGCPEPGQTFPAQPTPGYKFLFTVKGVIYEVHTNLDGSAIVLCNNAALRVETALSIYRNPTFSIGYPEKWIVTPRGGGEVFIGPTAQQVCAQPGMVVFQLGKVEQNKTASALIDDYLAANQSVVVSGARETVARTGQSVLFTGACSDGTARSFRLSAYIGFGQGYRLLQYTLTPAFGQWADIYRKIADEFSPSSTGNTSLIVTQPENAPNTLLLHRYGGNVYAAAVGDFPGTPITRDADPYFARRRYLNARVSPDGRRALMIDPSRKALIIVGIEKQPRGTILADNAADSQFPPAWSPDGRTALYVSDEAALTLRAVGVDGKDNRQIAKLDIPLCQVKPGADPAAALLAEDRGAELLLEWVSPDLILISRACNGLSILGVNPNDGKATPLQQPIVRPRLSPDKKRLVGSLIGKLNIYDLASGKSEVFDPGVDLTVWSADSSAVFYSTRAVRQPLRLEAETAGYAPFTSSVNEVTIRRFDPLTKQDTLVYQGEGYAIGTIAPHAEGIAFTVVQSSAALIEGLSRTTNPAELLKLAPVAQLYWLPNGADAPVLIGNTSTPQFGPPGSVAEIGLPVAPRPTLPAR
jgi:hypothetical protein